MSRLPGLDLLRAIAIVWVMLFHTGGARIPMPFKDFSIAGWMGVDLFFVLSGFLIGCQLFKSVYLEQTINIRQFYISRALRILPAYLAVVSLYFLLPFTRESGELPPLWQFFSFSVNLFVDINTNTFSHVWSLCVEEHFYLLFPIIVLLLMNRSNAIKIVTLALFIIGFGMYLRADIWLNEITAYPVYPQYVEKIYYPTYTRLDGLLAGVLLASIKIFKPNLWQLLSTHANKVLVAGLSGLALAVWIFEYRFDFMPTVIGFPILSWSFALIVAAASCSNSMIGRFKIPGVNTIATLAFSLYLTHKSVFYVVKTSIGSELASHGLLAFLVYGMAVLIVAGILYLLVERPFLSLRHQLFSGKKEQTLPVQPIG